MFTEEKNSVTKQEAIKTLALGVLVLLLIIFLSILISKFGNDIFNYINVELEKILSDSLTAKTIAVYQKNINDWIEKIHGFLEIDINYLEEIENIMG